MADQPVLVLVIDEDLNRHDVPLALQEAEAGTARARRDCLVEDLPTTTNERF